MVNFKDGQLVENGYVEINGVKYPVQMPKYAGETSITSERLNKLQADLARSIKEAIEDFHGTVLYYNENGTVGTVIFDDLYTHYDEIEIFAGKDEIGMTSVRIPAQLYEKTINLIQSYYVSGIMQIVQKQMKFSGNSLVTVSSPSYMNITLSSKTISEAGTENKIKIYKVVGYKNVSIISQS